MSGRELFSDNKEKFANGFNNALNLDGGGWHLIIFIELLANSVAAQFNLLHGSSYKCWIF